MSADKQLQKHLLDLLIAKSSNYLNYRQLTSLTKVQGHSYSQIFTARYSQEFIANISSKQVFISTVQQLQNMICADKQLKISSKQKNISIFEGELFIKAYIQLLFTQQEKRIIYHMISNLYNSAKQQELDCQDQSQMGVQLLCYLFQNIFQIKKGPSEQQSSSQHCNF